MSTVRTVYEFRVAEIRDHNPVIREVFFKAEGPEFRFKAGQFATMHIPQDPKPALRAYSFASDETLINQFRLVFKKVEGGVASRYVWSFKGEENVRFTGPFGRVLFLTPPTQQILFLCTGSGISQHLSFLESEKHKFPNLRYRLVLGLLNESELCLKDQLLRLKSEFKDFDFQYILANPSATWEGKKGFVQHFIQEFDYQNIPTTFYLCGNPAMIKDARSLLEKENFDKTRILAEAFN